MSDQEQQHQEDQHDQDPHSLRALRKQAIAQCCTDHAVNAGEFLAALLGVPMLSVHLIVDLETGATIAASAPPDLLMRHWPTLKATIEKLPERLEIFLVPKAAQQPAATNDEASDA